MGVIGLKRVWNTIAFCVVEGYGSSRRANVTVETIHGDIFDCVDIYKQPALLHPLLDKERIRRTIAKELEKQRLKAKQPQKDQFSYFNAEEYWLNKEGCPYWNCSYSTSDKGTGTATNSQRCLPKGISIKASPAINRFTGASTIVTLYNPQVNGPGQYTSATIFLESGDATNLEQIQTGWIVHPQLNGDGRTRLYTYWTADGHQKTGCYNSICPGFVQLSSEIPVDYAFPKVSLPQYDSQELQIQIYKDQEYYLQLFSVFVIGLWPDDIFKALRNGSETVRYGGQAHTPAGETVSPPMGNGQFWAGYKRLTCRMRQIMYGVDIDQEVQPDESLVQTHRDRCYCEGNENNARDGYWDYNFLFGGPGNCTDAPPTC
ncbi:protein neprosin-like [Nicotiana sylvestris]|uniref:protein neprosin-like n=1 Tax=Nicotiana sylvestris TaxID=4096 RepID=UPI00388C8EBC